MEETTVSAVSHLSPRCPSDGNSGRRSFEAQGRLSPNNQYAPEKSVC
jgi:hypothetical protein